jgi:hypothetical protein
MLEGSERMSECFAVGFRSDRQDLGALLAIPQLCLPLVAARPIEPEKREADDLSNNER